MTDRIREKVLASIITDMDTDGPPRGVINRAIHKGLLEGFRHMLAASRIKRTMAEDAARLRTHAQELLDWDIGDDGATAAQMREIADRIGSQYGLTITAADSRGDNQ